MGNVNIWAVVVSAVASMVLGTIWYSKAVFGPKWMRLIGKTQDQLKGSNKAMFLMLVPALVKPIVFGIVINYTGMTGLSAGFFLGLLLWLGFVATTSSGEIIYEGRPKQLWLVNNGYNLINMVVVGMIMATWR
jgi:hypothetical protein